MQVVHIMSGVNQLLLSELFSSGRFEWLCRPNGPALDLQELRRLAFSHLLCLSSYGWSGEVNGVHLDFQSVAITNENK